MFKKIKQRLAIEEEVKQLRREIRVLRQENEIKTGTADELFRKLTVARAEKKNVQKDKSDLVVNLVELREKLKLQEHENERLRDMLEPLSCTGCAYEGHYRKCVSCARYPKLKDKYVEYVEETTDECKEP